jgi:hypothetical protein
MTAAGQPAVALLLGVALRKYVIVQAGATGTGQTCAVAVPGVKALRAAARQNALAPRVARILRGVTVGTGGPVAELALLAVSVSPAPPVADSQHCSACGTDRSSSVPAGDHCGNSGPGSVAVQDVTAQYGSVVTAEPGSHAARARDPACWSPALGRRHQAVRCQTADRLESVGSGSAQPLAPAVGSTPQPAAVAMH